MYETPISVMQEQINKILGTGSEDTILTDLIRLSLLKNASKDESLLVIPEIFNLLGPEKFTQLISLVDGKTVTFPTKEKFKDIVQISLCYYLRTELGMSWDDIKEELNAPDLNTVKLGINASAFEAWLDEQIKKRLK